jgi:hypothetical protein
MYSLGDLCLFSTPLLSSAANVFPFNTVLFLFHVQRAHKWTGGGCTYPTTGGRSVLSIPFAPGRGCWPSKCHATNWRTVLLSLFYDSPR